MTKIIKNILQAMKTRANDIEFIKRHRTEPQNFTRDRKLTFEKVLMFVFGMVHTNLDTELDRFSEETETESASGAAISKARDRLQYTAFRELLNETQELIPSDELFKGRRLIAVDGMQGQLPNTPQLRTYNIHNTDRYPNFHAVSTFDVLNCKFLDAEIEMKVSNEREVALTLLKKHNLQNDILLFDRGFPSLQLIQELDNFNIKYVMRVSKSFLQEVAAFAAGTETDQTVNINYLTRRGATSRVRNVKTPYIFKLRCVRIKLPKEDEILVTNIFENDFTSEDIGEMYRLRWGIETSFNHLKHAIKVEEFVGIKENAVKQEFYASLFKYNLVLCFAKEAQRLSDLADAEDAFKKTEKVEIQA